MEINETSNKSVTSLRTTIGWLLIFFGLIPSLYGYTDKKQAVLMGGLVLFIAGVLLVLLDAYVIKSTLEDDGGMSKK